MASCQISNAISQTVHTPRISNAGTEPLLRKLAFWRLALWAGLAWIALPAPSRASDLASRTLLLDAALAGQAVIVVGERGIILRSDDDARSWTEATSHTAATLTAVSFANPRLGWAVGHDGLILVTTDGGSTWARQWQSDNLSDSFLDVLALDATHTIAVGAYGLYVTTSDGGKTWERRKILPDDYHLNRITRGPQDTLYLAGEHGTVLRSINRGISWVPIPTPYDGSFYGVLPLAPHAILAYGLRGRVFRSENNGQSWTPVLTNETGLLATGIRLERSGLVVLAGQTRAMLVGTEPPRDFARRDVGVATGIAELLELPNGNVLAAGEAGVTVIDLSRLAPAP